MYYIVDNQKIVAKFNNVADVVEYVFMMEIPLKTLSIINGNDVDILIGLEDKNGKPKD